MSGTLTPQHNLLLAALPAASQNRLFPHLKRVSFPLGKVLYESAHIAEGIFSNGFNRVAAVCHGGWCLGRNFVGG